MQEVKEKINSSQPFICGGTPRDRYLKHLENISDVDITTGDKTVDYLSQEFAQILKKKYNITRKAMDDGHSTIYIGSFKMDFSSNFNVPGIENILSKINISKPTEMQKEMFSRDFTCNSLLLSLDLKSLVDPTHRGFKDLDDKIIRTCLSPDITLTTNRNRVVRAIYLASKLDFDIDPSIIQFVQKHPESIKISTEKVMVEKINEAFTRNPERAAYLVSKMNLWESIPISQIVYPYYMKNKGITKKQAYFQGGGGVNEPAPKKKKYPSDKAIVVQPRFEEPFYKNYDVPGKHGPGAGWNDMGKYKSISEFLKDKRKKLKNKYKADDSWIEDDGKITKNPAIKSRATFLSRILKIAKLDQNDIDFPDDAYIDPNLGSSIDDGSVGAANLTGGYLDKYLPEDDLEGKPASTLNFNRDYSGSDQYPSGCPNCGFIEGAGNTYYDASRPCPKCNKSGTHTIDPDIVKKLTEKYLGNSTTGLFGLPDGVNLPDDEDPVSTNINPDFGTLDNGITMYEDKWNI